MERPLRRVFRSSFLLLVLTVLSVATVSGESFQFRHITLRDGLSNNSVYCLTQDDLGFMWLGTFSGLNRTDGHEISVYRPEPMNPDSISGSVVFDIFEDDEGTLWIGTDGGGLNRYDIVTDAFISYLPDGSDDAIASEKVFTVAEGPDRRIWVGTADAGISILNRNRDRFTTLRAASTDLLRSDVIRVIYRDRSDRMWIGTQGGGLSWVDRAGTVGNAFPSATVRDIFEDSDGALWIGFENDGLARLDATTGGEPSFTVLHDGLTVRTINEDIHGRIWVGTERSGVIVAPGTAEERRIRHNPDDINSLSSDFVRDIYTDASGLVWIATRGGGVNIYNPRSTGFIPLIPDEFATRRIIETRDGSIWVATDGAGVYRVRNDDEIEHYHADAPPPFTITSDHVYALAEDPDGSIWVGSDGDGLDRLVPGRGVVTTYRHDSGDDTTLSSDVIWSLLIDQTGTLWVGSEGGGLNLFERETDSFVHFRNDPDRYDSLLGRSVRSLYQTDDGTLWIGTWDGGLSRKVNGEDRFVNYSRDPNDPYSISDNGVNTIIQTPDGGIWLGTSGGGLNAFDPETERFVAFRTDSGLTDDNVLAIVPDVNGYLWITTANGMSRFDLITEQFITFWDSDGLPDNEFGRASGVALSSGYIAVGTASGAVRFNPITVQPNPYAPPIRITGFSLFNRPVDQRTRIADRVYLEQSILTSDTVNIYPGDTFIGFRFASLDYTNPSKNKYAVQLIGFDTELHALDTRNEYFYASLPPGEYTFNVIGTNSNGVWSTQSAQIDIEVHPSFVQTWYFYALVVAIVAVIVAVAARIRIDRLNRYNRLLREYSKNVQDAREDERRSVARDVHDELGQMLTALKMHIFWLSRNAASREEQRQARYDSMLGLVGATLDWTKDMASRLRPAIIDNLSITEAIEWLVADTESRTDLTINRFLEPTPELDRDRATSIFRLVQEILTNIIRHSRAQSADFELRSDDEYLYLHVHDDGIGVTKEELIDPRSYGIIGMKERVRYLHGEISFRANGVGTTVDVRIPVKETDDA